jgi:hypothetical protein
VKNLKIDGKGTYQALAVRPFFLEITLPSTSCSITYFLLPVKGNSDYKELSKSPNEMNEGCGNTLNTYKMLPYRVNG